MWDLSNIDSLSLPGALLGLVILFTVSVIRGWFIPKNTHERELNQVREVAAKEKTRGDEWKEAAMDQRAVNQEIRKQNTDLLETARITSKFFADINMDIEDTRPRDVGP